MKLRDHKRKTSALSSTNALQKMELDRLSADNTKLQAQVGALQKDAERLNFIEFDCRSQIGEGPVWEALHDCHLGLSIRDAIDRAIERTVTE